MADYALLFCGFSLEESSLVRDLLIENLNQDIDLFSASMNEKNLISEILEGAEPVFEFSSSRFMMFLGFDDEMISKSLSVFPAEIKRPLFCTITENNFNWTTAYLMQHLTEEDKEIKKRI